MTIDTKRLRELLEKATPDWRLRKNGVVVGGPFHEYTNGAAQSQVAMFCHLADSEDWQAANAELAVAAINALPELLDLAERYESAPEGSGSIDYVDRTLAVVVVREEGDAAAAFLQVIDGQRVRLVRTTGESE